MSSISTSRPLTSGGRVIVPIRAREPASSMRSMALSGRYRSDKAIDLMDEAGSRARIGRSEEHTSELQSQSNLVCRLLLEKKTHTCSRSSSRQSPPSIFMLLTPRRPQPGAVPLIAALDPAPLPSLHSLLLPMPPLHHTHST